MGPPYTEKRIEACEEEFRGQQDQDNKHIQPRILCQRNFSWISQSEMSKTFVIRMVERHKGRLSSNSHNLGSCCYGEISNTRRLTVFGGYARCRLNMALAIQFERRGATLMQIIVGRL